MTPLEKNLFRAETAFQMRMDTIMVTALKFTVAATYIHAGRDLESVIKLVAQDQAEIAADADFDINGLPMPDQAMTKVLIDLAIRSRDWVARARKQMDARQFNV